MPFSDAINLFIDVLWARSKNNDEVAKEILHSAQQSFFSVVIQYIIILLILIDIGISQCWPKNNLFVADLDSDDNNDNGTQLAGHLADARPPDFLKAPTSAHDNWPEDFKISAAVQLKVC